MISAILLAAGKSERMGKFKQLLPLAGKTFVECCVDNLLASTVTEVVVVTGHNAADVRRALQNRPVRFAHNPDYDLGMASSIIRGFKCVSEDCDAVLVALGDQPLIQTQVINQVVAGYTRSGASIVVPTYQGKNGHPIVISKSLAGDVESMDLNTGLRRVLDMHRTEIEHVPVDSDSILLDFDYPEDYQRIERNK